MKNSNQTPTNSKKVNQIIFVEYQNPTKDGHFITTSDSYRNTIGKIHRSFNTETKKFEYVAYDHAGKPISEKTEKLWELKKMFTDNSKQLLADAHTRRLEEKSRSISSEKAPVDQSKKQEEKKIGTEKSRQEKPSTEKITNTQPYEREEKNEITMEETEQAIREHDLDQIREREDGREDRSVER